ncbi:hypothetical protein ACFE04_004841 [Oxalis oulophora]
MAIMRLVPYLLFLLIALTLKPLLVTCTNAPVLDNEGNPLLSNNSYRIHPASFSYHGEIAIQYINDTAYIAQHESILRRGFPVSFIPKENINNTGIIYYFSNVRIQFMNSNQWKVAEKEEKTGKYFLIPGEPKAKGDWFQIVNASGSSYKITYCHKQSCPSVGPEQDYEHKRRLVLGDYALKFTNTDERVNDSSEDSDYHHSDSRTETEFEEDDDFDDIDKRDQWRSNNKKPTSSRRSQEAKKPEGLFNTAAAAYGGLPPVPPVNDFTYFGVMTSTPISNAVNAAYMIWPETADRT